MGIAQLKWAKRNPEKAKASIRAWQLRTKYGVTVEQWDEMFAVQNGKCLICATHQNDLPTDLCVDHCHQTGQVRGLLCKRCNTGLGGFRDRPELLENALRYLASISPNTQEK